MSRQHKPPKKPTEETTYQKYRAKRTTIDGITFASKMEARRYVDLKQQEKQGLIRNLELQPTYRIDVGGHRICLYKADFRYFDVQKGQLIVEDVKGAITQVYSLKAKLMKAVHGIEILETRA